jgi:hypothetical protein
VGSKELYEAMVAPIVQAKEALQREAIELRAAIHTKDTELAMARQGQEQLASSLETT